MKKTNIIVMAIAGVVLLIAAVFKIHQLLTEPEVLATWRGKAPELNKLLEAAFAGAE